LGLRGCHCHRHHWYRQLQGVAEGVCCVGVAVGGQSIIVVVDSDRHGRVVCDWNLYGDLRRLMYHGGGTAKKLFTFQTILLALSKLSLALLCRMFLVAYKLAITRICKFDVLFDTVRDLNMAPSAS